MLIGELLSEGVRVWVENVICHIDPLNWQPLCNQASPHLGHFFYSKACIGIFDMTIYNPETLSVPGAFVSEIYNGGFHRKARFCSAGLVFDESIVLIVALLNVWSINLWYPI